MQYGLVRLDVLEMALAKCIVDSSTPESFSTKGKRTADKIRFIMSITKKYLKRSRPFCSCLLLYNRKLINGISCNILQSNMSNQRKPSYTCEHCERGYYGKVNYDRHVTTCGFLQKSKREQLNDVDMLEHELPTRREMFLIIQELGVRLNKVEADNKRLKNNVASKRRINYTEWLHSLKKNPETTFIDWVNDNVIPNIPTVIETAYKENVFTAMELLFENVFKQIDVSTLPICSFSTKRTTFFVYNNNQSWTSTHRDELENIMTVISNRFIVVFQETWYEDNKALVFIDERTTDLYNEYYKKILGGVQYNSENRYNKVYNKLHQLCRRETPAGPESE